MAIVNVNKSNLNDLIKSKNVTILEFWANWCPVCKMTEKVMLEVSKESGVTVGRVNAERYSDIADRFGVLSIPTFIFFKSGVKRDRFSGYLSQKQMENRIERLKQNVK